LSRPLTARALGLRAPGGGITKIADLFPKTRNPMMRLNLQLRRPTRDTEFYRRDQHCKPHLESLEDRQLLSGGHDVLDIGDTNDNSVKQFDATTGAYLGKLVDGSKSLDGPRGMVFDGQGHLLVANQNVNRGKPGEIMKYDAATGAFLDELVPFQDPNTPFAPRGMVRKDNILYVASLQNGSTSHGITPSGEIDAYNATTGAFLSRTTPPATMINGLADQQFNPRAIVFGPDGNLYVSAFDPLNPIAGYVLQLNETTHPGAWSIVAFNNGDAVADPGETADLHRPEGLVFGPDGNLYVTSFRASVDDTDKIVIFNAGGTEVDNIPLDAVGQPRAFGMAILFGPGGHLFVPISGSGPDTGAVRSYDVGAKTFTNFVAAIGSPLGSPWYLTFGKTDPATLAYNSNQSADHSIGTTAGQGQANSQTSGLDPLLIGANIDQPLDQVDLLHPLRRRSTP
jgi:hypothetical protein